MRRLMLTVLILGCATACDRRAPAPTTAPSPEAQATASSPTSSAEGLRIEFSPVPNPPRSGDVVFEARIVGSDGANLSDASVTAVAMMPAMPTMNMPEMSTSVPLEAVGGGLYRGKGNLVMGGTWNVTVTVTQGGQKTGTGKFVIQAK